MIKSVQLVNFGAIREAYFQPLENGITGIFGPNGAGKSTILTGVLFALFGVTPKNVTVGGMRRTGSEKEECSVSVLFTNAGQDIEIIREITGSKNTVRARLIVDGIEQTVDSVSAAETWVKERLGVDAKGFTTAFVVRQKELDELVSEVPSKRKEIVERLAGIDTLKDALQNARKDENISKEVLKTVPGSAEDVQKSESELLLIIKETEAALVQRQVLETDLEKAKDAFSSTQSELSLIRERQISLNQLNSQISSVKSNIEVLESSIASVEYTKTSEESYDLDAMRVRYNELKDELASKRQKHGSLQVEIASSHNKVNYVKERLGDLPFLDDSLANFDIVELKNTSDELFTAGQSLSKRRYEIEARSNDVSESILQLDHSSECPTCYTPLDSLGDLLGRLNSMVDAFNKELAEVVISLESNAEESAQVNQQIRNVSAYLDSKKLRDSLQEDLRVAVSGLIDNSELEVLADEITSLMKEVEASTEAGVRAKTFLEDKAKHEQFYPQLQNSSQELVELEIKSTELASTIDIERARFLESQYPFIEGQLRTAAFELDKASKAMNQLDTRMVLAESKMKSVNAQWKRKKDLLLAQEKKALTREVIDNYRQQTIASLTPELSEYASALINDITTGAYDTVNVDDDFKITVRNSKGVERKASELSGGEESAVALALRLAIGSLITGGQQELLWLDEVLTAQDADRRASMLATIRDLSISQIIMINHTAEAADIADRTVTVIPDLDGGSVLENTDRPSGDDYVDNGDDSDDASWEGLADD